MYQLCILIIVALFFSGGVNAERQGKVQCMSGQYLKNKGSPDEKCKVCPQGKYSGNQDHRKKKCKKCGINKWQVMPGSTSCHPCPPDFTTKGKRGAKQCIDSAGMSMRRLSKAYYDESQTSFSYTAKEALMADYQWWVEKSI
jgi:hypothetical protein